MDEAGAPRDEVVADGVLEAVMVRLGDAVLAALAPVDAGRADASVVQRGGVVGVEFSAEAAVDLLGGGGVL